MQERTCGQDEQPSCDGIWLGRRILVEGGRLAAAALGAETLEGGGWLVPRWEAAPQAVTRTECVIERGEHCDRRRRPRVRRGCQYEEEHVHGNE